MKKNIKKELLKYIQDLKQAVNKKTHFNMFTKDYYVLNYKEADQWLKKHNLNTFKAINICREYEKKQFGEFTTKFDDSAKLVNHLVYWYGQDLCNELKIPID